MHIWPGENEREESRKAWEGGKHPDTRDFRSTLFNPGLSLCCSFRSPGSSTSPRSWQRIMWKSWYSYGGTKSIGIKTKHIHLHFKMIQKSSPTWSILTQLWTAVPIRSIRPELVWNYPPDQAFRNPAEKVPKLPHNILLAASVSPHWCCCCCPISLPLIVIVSIICPFCPRSWKKPLLTIMELRLRQSNKKNDDGRKKKRK